MEERNVVDTNEWLFRRGYGSPEKKYMNPDGTATSRVFKLRHKENGELSVDVASLTTPEMSVGDKSKYMLFSLANSSVEENNLKTYHSPMDDGSNNAHAVIIGMPLEDDILPGILARASKRIYI